MLASSILVVGLRALWASKRTRSITPPPSRIWNDYFRLPHVLFAVYCTCTLFFRDLGSRSFFERLLLARLNHEGTLSDVGDGVDGEGAGFSSSGTSPLAYMIGCYGR